MDNKIACQCPEYRNARCTREQCPSGAYCHHQDEEWEDATGYGPYGPDEYAEF